MLLQSSPRMQSLARQACTCGAHGRGRSPHSRVAQPLPGPAHALMRPLPAPAQRTLTMLGTTPSIVTPAASTNCPKGRPCGLPCSSAMVAPFSSAAGQGGKAEAGELDRSKGHFPAHAGREHLHGGSDVSRRQHSKALPLSLTCKDQPWPQHPAHAGGPAHPVAPPHVLVEVRVGGAAQRRDMAPGHGLGLACRAAEGRAGPGLDAGLPPAVAARALPPRLPHTAARPVTLPPVVPEENSMVAVSSLSATWACRLVGCGTLAKKSGHERSPGRSSTSVLGRLAL